jgi:hypothetical protein
VRSDHAEVPVLGIDVGVDISADSNRLIPSDKQTRRYLVALWDDPAPEIDRIGAAARIYHIEWSLIGILAGSVAVGGTAVAVRERLRGWPVTRLTRRHSSVPTTGACATVTVTLLALLVESLGASLLPHQEHHAVRSSPGLDGTTLEDLVCTAPGGGVLLLRTSGVASSTPPVSPPAWTGSRRTSCGIRRPARR